MAKISPVSIKYMIHASFKSQGPLEKPDVIGALFGQTEGLLGSELEMRELQKEGKIGRIEVELEIIDGKSVGEIKLPSALDKSETTLIAAALETIDRIGPTEAEIKVIKIEDVRGSKRDYILERAKKLLEGLDSESSDEMSKNLKEETRAAKIQEYGEEKLPAGDLSGNEVIVVEGRADVVNLLKNRVNNVIGMNGTKLPREIAKLGDEKEITLFVDGDRGGKLIAANVIKHARVAYVAVAPDGKEVEELQGKEILIALRKKITIGEFLRYNKGIDKESNFNELGEEPKAEVEEVNVDPKVAKDKLRVLYEGVKGAKVALLVDSNFDVIRKVSTKEEFRAISTSRRPVFAVIYEGSANSQLIEVCEQANVKYIAASTFSSIKETKIALISL